MNTTDSFYNTTEPFVPVYYHLFISQYCTMGIAVVGLIFNLVTLILFFKLPRWNTSDYYCIAICVSDCFESVSWASFFLTLKMYLQKPTDQLAELDNSFGIALNVSLLFSWFANTGLAVCRFFIVNKPNSYRRIYKKKVVALEITFYLIVSILISSPTMAYSKWATADLLKVSRVVSAVSMIIILIFCCTTIIYAYIRNIMQLKAMNRQCTIQDSKNIPRVVSELERMFIAIAVLFLLLNVPAALTGLLGSIGALTYWPFLDELNDMLYQVDNWSYFLQAAANTVDPVIYIYFRPEFREACCFCFK